MKPRHENKRVASAVLVTNLLESRHHVDLQRCCGKGTSQHSHEWRMMVGRVGMLLLFCRAHMRENVTFVLILQARLFWAYLLERAAVVSMLDLLQVIFHRIF